MKILLLGDFSNLHNALGGALAGMGHDVTVISEGCGWQDTRRDIDIRRRPGLMGGLLYVARLCGPLHRHLRGYDVVALQTPHFLQLKPSRLRWFFDRLRRENGAVFLSAASTDQVYIREAFNRNSPLRYNEFRIGDAPAPLTLADPQTLAEWRTPEMEAYADYFYDHIDGAVSALYEYDVALRARLEPERVAYGGIPIDLKMLPFKAIDPDIRQVRLFLGRHRDRKIEKGTDLLETAARRVADASGGRVTLNIVENLPFSQYIGTMTDSHILLDQIYSYTPATNALMAMARGLNVVTGGEEDYYRFIGETENRPIINAPIDVDELTETLREACADTVEIARRGAASRAFVEKHNAADVVARRYLDFWTKRLNEK
ncbi:MAG: glycosyltransferase [Muribaculaceae bacterium]